MLVQHISEHISEEDLEAYAMQHPCPVDNIEEHLLICEECQNSLATLDQEIALVRFVLGDEEVVVANSSGSETTNGKSPALPLTKSAGN
jgi:hypothetical protein